MMKLERILAPIDLSTRSIGTARYAIDLSRRLGAELKFVHAVRRGSSLEAEEAEVLSAIAELRKGVPGGLIICEGNPVPVILQAAQSTGTDVILMPTQSRGPLHRLFAKSVAAHVLREAPCPVWTGHDDLSLFVDRPVRKVLCGLSLGPRSDTVLRWAAGFAAVMGASLSVAHASKGLDSIPGYRWDAEWRNWLRSITRREIDGLVSTVDTPAEVHLEAGDPLTRITRLSESLQADLLVIGKSPPRRLMGDLRTMSYNLVRYTSCPVASV